MFYFLVGISTTALCCGVILFLKKPFSKLAQSSVRQVDTILDKCLEESAKDKLIIKNLKKLLFHFFTVIIGLFLIITACVLPLYFYAQSEFGTDVNTSSFYFYLSMIIGSFVIFFFKNKSSDYSYWSKLFHRIILDNYNISKYLFRKEKKRILKKGGKTSNDFVIVTGLARGGTTALTNLLYEPTVFHSISYSSMPFLMAPRLWKKVYNPKTKKVKERAHGDKVLFSESSIEALEEYFFKAFLNDSFIGQDYLERHEVDTEIYEEYLNYQLFFKQPSLDTIYLAKNNNFILRYPALREYNSMFKVIMIFRDPVAHAGSLLNQHINFKSQQTEDHFVLEYMNWLGHYEFGLNQKVFNLNDQRPWEKHSKESINYWLEIWMNYYNYFLNLPEDPNLFLVHYDDLLYSPQQLKSTLCKAIGLEINVEKISKFDPPHRKDKNHQIDSEILQRAKNIYDQLVSRQFRIDVKSPGKGL